MTLLCPFRELFGKPKEGFHKQRFLGLALYDVVGTILIAGIVSFYSSYNFFIVLLILFIIAEVLHLLFCVDTAVIKFLKN